MATRSWPGLGPVFAYEWLTASRRRQADQSEHYQRRYGVETPADLGQLLDRQLPRPVVAPQPDARQAEQEQYDQQRPQGIALPAPRGGQPFIGEDRA